MLARVAETLYWMARYMERAENMARLINVNANLILDILVELRSHFTFSFQLLR